MQLAITALKNILKEVTWFFWPSIEQLKERGLNCKYEPPGIAILQQHIEAFLKE